MDDNRRTLDSGFFSEDEWERIIDDLGLSPRKAQVLQGIFNDQKATAIAFDLGISPSTVYARTRRLYSALGVRSRVKAVLYVMRRYYCD